MRLKLCLTGAALAGLAACAAPGGPEADQARLTAELDRAAAALRAANAGTDPWNAPAAAPRAVGSATAIAAAGSPVAAEPVGQLTPVSFQGGGNPVREARGLLGANAPALIRALGQPDLRRREGDGEAWLYRGQTCMLDVVLYPDPVQGRDARVAFAAARATGLERVPEHACLSEITRAHQLVARARE